MFDEDHDGTASIINKTTNEEIDRVNVGKDTTPYGVAVSPSGKKVYVANNGGLKGGSASVIDTDK